MPGAVSRTRAAVAAWPTTRAVEQPGVQPMLADLPEAAAVSRATPTTVDVVEDMAPLKATPAQASAAPPTEDGTPTAAATPDVVTPSNEVPAADLPIDAAASAMALPPVGERWRGSGGAEYTLHDDGAGGRYIQAMGNGNSVRFDEGTEEYQRTLAEREKLLAAAHNTPYSVAGRLLAGGR